MVNLLGSFMSFYRQYSLSEIANLFTIVEGIATVVAAVGAIIAVIITKRISKEQMRLATKQNEIARSQADIANQQNKIALYKERFSVYECVNKICMFGNAHKSGKFLLDAYSTQQTLALWCTCQRNDFQLSEKISFVPRNAEEKLEYETHKDDLVTKKEDDRVMRKMLANDSLILKRGSAIFPDPIRTELRNFEKAYHLYILCHIFLKLGISPSKDLDLSKLAQEFFTVCDSFATNSPMMRYLLEELSF